MASSSSSLYSVECPTNEKDKAKWAAAKAAVEAWIPNKLMDKYETHGKLCIGVGSGSTVVYVAHWLAHKYHSEGIEMECVPTSFQARQLIVDTGLVLSDLARTPALDVAFDGADEFDRSLHCIKGGGACQTLEKLVASCSSNLVIVADSSKQSSVLGTKWTKGVPIEVLPDAYVPVARKIEQLGGKASLRMAQAKAGPVVTDNGNFVLDADFGEIHEPETLNRQLREIVGVIETGLFCNMATQIYVAKNADDMQVFNA